MHSSAMGDVHNPFICFNTCNREKRWFEHVMCGVCFTMYNAAEINRNDINRSSIAHISLQTDNALTYMSREKGCIFKGVYISTNI